MNINKLELKNIKYFATLSEETPCYDATVYINDKKAIHVSNRGCGASDSHDVYPQFLDEWIEKAEGKKLLETINQYCFKTFGTEKTDWGEIEYDLEHWCQKQMYEHVDQKKLKRDMKTKFICVDIDKNELYAYAKKGHSDVAFQNHMDKNHPNDTCLNFLEFDLAWKFYNGVV